jgi:hypothetical protein
VQPSTPIGPDQVNVLLLSSIPSGLIGKTKSGHTNPIPDNFVEVCGNTAEVMSAWERNVDFKMHSHEEALVIDSNMASWIQFAQNAALDAHTYILEDGPELPKSSGPHPDEGGEVLEGMYAQDYT